MGRDEVYAVGTLEEVDWTISMEVIRWLRGMYSLQERMMMSPLAQLRQKVRLQAKVMQVIEIDLGKFDSPHSQFFRLHCSLLLAVILACSSCTFAFDLTESFLPLHFLSYRVNRD